MNLFLASLAFAADRPNILYIMSDDHAAHAISAYGGRLAQVAPTPNIDRLAAEGALFANAETPPTVQGFSFKSLLETGQEREDWQQEAYYRYWMHMAHHDNPAHLGMRTKTHKLIYYYGCNYDGCYQTPPGWELYDLVNDPMETRNVIDRPENQQLAAELKQRLAALRERVGDDRTHFPKCEKIVQEFWDDDSQDRAKAVELSHEFLSRRQAELKAGKKSPRTWSGE